MADGQGGNRPPRPGSEPPDPAELAKDRAEALRLVPVSRETADRLDRLAEMLFDWQRRVNLVAGSTLPQLWTRHIADSAQLVALAPDAKVWVDLGSGGGFPGLVIACVLADEPGATVHLVESSTKKCAFLRAAAEALGLPVTVHCQRAEEFGRTFTGRADVVTARALAPLTELLTLAAPLLKTSGIGLFPKGQHLAVELTDAAKCWNIEAATEPSVTSTASGILVVRNLRPQPAAPARA